MDKRLLLSLSACLVLTACSSAPKHAHYQEASFELCNAAVDIYSQSDDGRVRILCSDGSKFALNTESTLDTMRDINIDYCHGEGLGKFNESSSYYSFKCKSGTLLSIAK
ncbi:hypothetical protein [Vibrio renipiscarius]|uniref:Lipoprotein n=1 Tax=Vibrio renipiscarius TaxID=1461322 RepID=A0A0C2NS33_9VIBR|nr:hypothetical protein [Vibrio renipiscarius]KII80433.1 hypothetical protein OJ16_03675 [Vibrio renipiscarius]KII82306.1 hypothetical protein PL18_01545 [Vibrio renipiscarius]